VEVSAVASLPEAATYPEVVAQALLASLRQAPEAHRTRQRERIDFRAWPKNRPRVPMLRNLADDK
jgi:hypothetical protein